MANNDAGHKKSKKLESVAEGGEHAEIDAKEAKRRRREAKQAAVAEKAVEEEGELIDQKEARKLKKAAKHPQADGILPDGAELSTKKLKKSAEEVEQEIDPIEAKRLRKVAKRAAREAAAVEALDEIDPAEAKRQRKAAKIAAREAAEVEAQTEIDRAEGKRQKKAAKRAMEEEEEQASALETSETKKTKKTTKFVEAEGSAIKEESGTTTKSQSSPEELTVFVGGLPFSCDADILRQDFEVCGEIAKMTMPLNSDGRSSGTAFISFKAQAGVEEALKYDGDYYGGRTLVVKVAGQVGERGRARGDSELEVCVKGLPNKAEDSSVRAEFASCGDIASLRVPRWPDGGCKGMAFITFQAAEGMAHALKLHEQIKMGSRYLSVQKAGNGGKGRSKGS